MKCVYVNLVTNSYVEKERENEDQEQNQEMENAEDQNQEDDEEPTDEMLERWKLEHLWYPDLIKNLNRLLQVVQAQHISLDFGKDMYLGLPGQINGGNKTHLNTVPFCQKMRDECQSLKIISMFGSSFFKVINSFTALISLRLEDDLMFHSDIDLSGA